MPQFYFHLRTPAGRNDDDTGLEFSGIEAAYLEACRTIPAMSADLVLSNVSPLVHAFEISDASGKVLIELPFGEVLDRGGAYARSASAQLRKRTRIEMVRTRRLIKALCEEHIALRDTLAETNRLLALSRPKRGQQS